jgi:hypothetical protein
VPLRFAERRFSGDLVGQVVSLFALGFAAAFEALEVFVVPREL